MSDNAQSARLHVLLLSSREADAAAALLSLKQGARVEYLRVESQSQFIDALGYEHWDIVLADYLMPDFGALPALSYLQAAGLELPVIVMLCEAAEEQVMEVMRAGASDVIVYGSWNSLLSMVKRIVSDFRQRTGRPPLDEADNLQPLSHLLDASQIGVMAWDAESDRITYHHNFETLFGEPYQPYDSHPERFFRRLHHEDRAHLEQTQYAEILSRDDLFYECRVVWPDESVHWLRALGKVFRDDQQIVSQVITVLQNVTDQKHLPYSTAHLEKERAVTRLHRRFMLMAAHEFRTPLTVISTANELLYEYYDQMSSEKHREYLLEIRARVRVLRDMLTEIESAARNEMLSLDFSPQPTDVPALCDRLLTEMLSRRALEDAASAGGAAPFGHRLRFKNQLDHPVHIIDSRLIGHILRRLLDNAVKYSPNDREVMLSVWQEAGMLRFSIRDQGIGIPQEDMPYIYELFMRGSNVGAISGRGIGLKLVLDCVQAHQGTIDIRSAINQGTMVTVTLPVSNL